MRNEVILSAAALLVPGGILAATVVFIRTRLARRERRLRSLVAHANDLIVLTDARGAVLEVSPSVERLLGYRADTLVGRHLVAYVNPDDRAHVIERVDRLREHPGEPAQTECRLLHADGGWVETEATVVNKLGDHLVGGLVYTFADIGVKKAVERQLRERVFRDTLTGVANRDLLLSRLGYALERSRQLSGCTALIVVNLDRFTAVIDRHGHDVGDEVLREVARRLVETARPFGTVARLGADEFAVLGEGVESVERATVMAEELREAIGEPILVGGSPVRVQASAGVAIDGHGAGAGDVLRAAQLACQAAKVRHPRRPQVYEPSMHTTVVTRLQLEEQLAAAIERDELVLHYQPIVEVRSGRLVAVEALVRWEHPTRGLLPPAEFVPLAEAAGLILALDRWVLSSAAGQAAAWHATYGDAAPSIAVNISGHHLADGDLVTTVATLLERYGCPPDLLTLEITETALAARLSGLQLLQRLRALGVRIAIDDFGMGYSSLGRLRDFPAQKLKIDRSFVAEITPDGRAPITDTIVALGHTLALEVIAEGVETSEQLAVLQRLGCDRAQGWLFGRAEPPQVTARLFGGRLGPAYAPHGGMAMTVHLSAAEALSDAAAGGPEALLDELLRQSGWDVAYVTAVDPTRQTEVVSTARGRDAALLIGHEALEPDAIARRAGLPGVVSTALAGPGGDGGSLCLASRLARPGGGREVALVEMAARLLGPETASARGS